MDIFTCGVCQKEYNSIREFYNHKLQNADTYKCLDCVGIQFHKQSQLTDHQKKCHNQTLNEFVCSDKLEEAQIEVGVAISSNSDLELDSCILEKLIEISSSSGNESNIQIILADSYSDITAKQSKDVEFVLIQNPVCDEIGNPSQDPNIIDANSSQNRIYICKECNHFSYQRSNVVRHINEIHRNLIDNKSFNFENLIQEMDLLPCNEFKQDAIHKNKVISVRPVEHVLNTSIQDLKKHEMKKVSQLLNKSVYPNNYCVDCKTLFKDRVLLKSHNCSIRLHNVEVPINKNANVDHLISSIKNNDLANEAFNISVTEDSENSKELDWEKMELSKEAVLSCVDHLYLESNDKQESSFSCITCEKTFLKKAEIRKHCLTHTNLKPYNCSKCKYATKLKSLFVKHFQTHYSSSLEEKCDAENVSEEFQCNLCPENCDNVNALIVHVRKLHDNSDGYETLLSRTCKKIKVNGNLQFRCYFCNVSFILEEECLDHLKSRHLINNNQPDLIVKIWKCQLCSHTTTYPKSFLRHTFKHKIIFTCSICEYKLLSFAQLFEHLENHVKCIEDESVLKINELIESSLALSWYLPEEITKEIDVVVNKACQKLRKDNELKLDLLIKCLKYKQLSFETFDHIKQCLGNVECYHCGRRFFTLAELKRHEGIHAVEKEHKCHLCDYSAATKNNLARHIGKIHEKKVFNCPDCDFTTMCITSLWSHKKNHQGQIECTECRKQFPKLKLLRQHMIDYHLDCVKANNKLESSDKKSIASSSFKCPHCSRQFHRSIQEFKRHMWIHEGVKPIKCTLCSYRCRTSNHLEVHMRKHSTVKAFQCPECLKDFKSKSSVQYHIQRFHSAEEKIMYSCDKCEYKTEQKGHLKLHQKNHLVVRNFSCQLCMYSSNTLSSLKGHYKKKHKGKEFDINEDKNNCDDGKVIVRAIQSGSSNYDSLNHQNQMEIRVFKCDTCDYKFTSVSEFRRHLKVKHGLINFKWDEVEVKLIQ